MTESRVSQLHKQIMQDLNTRLAGRGEEIAA